MLLENKSFDEMSRSRDWIAEPKYNGARCLIHIFNGKIEFWDRHGKHLKYNSDPIHQIERDEIKSELMKIFPKKGYFVLDSELRHNKVKGIQNLIMVYDIHVWNHELLNKITFYERRVILEKLFTKSTKKVQLIKQYHMGFKMLFKKLIVDNEIEGIVIKRRSGKLNLNRVSNSDSMWMFKIRRKSGSYRY